MYCQGRRDSLLQLRPTVTYADTVIKDERPLLCARALIKRVARIIFREPLKIVCEEVGRIDRGAVTAS